MDSAEVELGEIIQYAEKVIDCYNKKEALQFSEEELEDIFNALESVAPIVKERLHRRKKHSFKELLEISESVIEELGPDYPEVKWFKEVADRLVEECRGLGRPTVPTMSRISIDLSELGDGLELYLAHDISYIQMHMEGLYWFFHVPRYAVANYILRPNWTREQIQKFNERCTYSTKMMGYPYRILQYAAMERLGEELPLEQVSLAKIIKEVGSVMEGRANRSLAKYPDLEFEITYELEVDKVLSNEAMMWSVIYNNVKNSEKKLVEIERKKRSVIDVKTIDIDDDYFLLTFHDNGAPISIDKMKGLIRRALYEGQKLEYQNDEMEKRLRAWVRNPFSVNEIKHEDFTNVAFMAHMTGADNPSVTSGMGLWGTKYCIENLNGAIIYGEYIEDGSPIFAYVLPKVPKIPGRKRVEEIASFLKSEPMGS